MAKKWPPDPLTVLRGHAADVNCLAFGSLAADPSTELLVSGDTDGHMRVWNLATRRATVQINAAHDAALLHCAFTADGRVVSQSKDNTVKLWDLQTCAGGQSKDNTVKLDGVLGGADHSFCRMAIHDPGQPHTGSSGGGRAEPAPENAAEPSAGGRGSISNSAIVVAVSSTETNEVSVWDTRTVAAGRVVGHRTGGPEAGQCMSLLLHDGGRLLLSGYEDGSLDCYDLVAGRWMGLRDGTAADRKVHTEPVLGLTPLLAPAASRGKGLSSAGGRCISCGADGRMCVLDTPVYGSEPVAIGPARMVVESPSKGEVKGLNQLAVRQDGRIIAAASWTGYVYVHDVLKDFKLVCPLPVSSTARGAGRKTGGGVNCVAFATGLRQWWHLATASNDKRIMLWDIFGPRAG